MNDAGTNVKDHAHAYIHVPPTKAGEKFIRLNVPAANIRKFDYCNYTRNPEEYKNKLCTYKDDEGLKKKCFILTAADSFYDVQHMINSGKRFRIPKLQESIHMSSESSIDNIKDDKEILERTKSERKEFKKCRTENKKQENDDIINKYINNNIDSFLHKSYNDDVEDAEVSRSQSETPATNFRTSTPQKSFTNSALQCEECKAMNVYKMQASYLSEKCRTAELEAETRKRKYEEALKNVNGFSCTFCAEHKQDAENLAYLDKVYMYSSTLAVEQETIGDKILLSNGVSCNAKAYRDSIKAKNPIEVIKLLSTGVYGYEDLAKRCVRKQKNNKDHIELDQNRSEAIERVFYRYLRLNRYPMQLIKKELGKCSTYHHNAIVCARSKMKRQNDVEETMAALQNQVDQINDGTAFSK